MSCKSLFVFFLFFSFQQLKSQELYINTEPASLIPKGTKVVRLHHHTFFLNETNTPSSVSNAKVLIPSISYGISKKIMVSASFQFSNNPYDILKNLLLMDINYIQNKGYYQPIKINITLDYRHL